MKWQDLFKLYGSPSKEANIRISGYLIRPDCLTRDHIKWNDESAARMIQEMLETAEALKGYRQELAARYAELSAMAYSLRLDFTRYRQYKGSVTYYLRLVRVYTDGHEEIEEETKYPGSKRSQAFKDYKAELKARPGIETKLDIEKARLK